MSYNCNYILKSVDKTYHQYSGPCFGNFYNSISEYKEIEYYVPVTGPAGFVTPFGEGILRLKDGIFNMKSTVTYMSDWPELIGLKSRIGARVPYIDEKIIPRKFRRSMSKMSIFAVKAVEEALLQAKLSGEMIKNEDTACILGSTTGSPFAIEESFNKIIKDKDISELTSMSFFKSIGINNLSFRALFP